MDKQHKLIYVLRKTGLALTYHCLNIFTCAMCASLSLKRAPCAQGKGQGLVILSQEIIHFASQQSSIMASRLCKVIGLVQTFSGNEFRGQNRLVCSEQWQPIHECNMLRDFCPKLRNKWNECFESMLLEYGIWFLEESEHASRGRLGTDDHDFQVKEYYETRHLSSRYTRTSLLIGDLTHLPDLIRLNNIHCI